jgi:hypothetical protein
VVKPNTRFDIDNECAIAAVTPLAALFRGRLTEQVAGDNFHKPGKVGIGFHDAASSRKVQSPPRFTTMSPGPFLFRLIQTSSAATYVQSLESKQIVNQFVHQVGALKLFSQLRRQLFGVSAFTHGRAFQIVGFKSPLVGNP